MPSRRISGLSVIISSLLLLAGPVWSQERATGEKSSEKNTETVITSEITSTYDIAVIDLSGICLLRPDVQMVSLMGNQASFDLMNIASRLNTAGNDEEIDGVLLNFSGAIMDLGQIDYLGRVIADLQAGGKKVYAYSESYSQSEYLLAGRCDKVIMPAAGEVALYGLMAESLYFKGLMDKVGLSADMISIGRYKSASESMTRSEPSEADIEQMSALLDDIFAIMAKTIADARDKEQKEVLDLIDNGPYSSREALANGLIDGVMYRDEFVSMLNSEQGRCAFHMDYDLERNTFSLEGQSLFAIIQELLKPQPQATDTNDNIIAVITLDGVITSGGDDTYNGSASGSETIRNTLKYCRNDQQIKAVVVRIDSPGGSALASDIIYNAIKLTAAVKPVVVSMGSVAASGGYYTACGAPYIFAEESTITGSIGVVGGKVCIGGLLDKVGIGSHSYSRGRNAGMISSLNEFSPLERQKITSQMLETYSLFKERILTSRATRIKGELENHAQGRVFSGRRALELGLVDEIGSLDHALTYAAQKADLGDDYLIAWLPRPQTMMEIVESLLAGTPGEDNNATVRLLSELL
ncbi:MAG: signal peptide peptidase SppA, partial [Sedimentisphaerales bacterium]|nr:signal peptide peptidase SppA [Sedimentisphaerales bacterium]